MNSTTILHDANEHRQDAAWQYLRATSPSATPGGDPHDESNALLKEYCRRLRRYRRPLKQIFGLWCCLLLASGCAFGATFRWSASLNRIYVEGGGLASLSNIKSALPNAPLDLVDAVNKIWLLRADLLIHDGSTLTLRGSTAGGDVNELRLQSLNSVTPCDCVVSITADWGTLDINGTKITSWDTMVGGPDTDPVSNGRAYIRVRSSLSTNGVTALESRMDILNSEISYLGTDASEAYGLVWKVSDLNPSPSGSIFEKVNVYGNVHNSRIHHNYIGVYTFGAFGMQWLNNEIAYNVQEGLGLREDSDSLVIQGNNVHHNGNHGLMASLRCDNLTVRGNLCWSNAQSGLLLHRSSNSSLVESNRCFDNGDSGIALTGTSQNVIRNNQLLRNATAGVRFDLGSADNLIANNQCASNTLYGFYFTQGSAQPEPNDDGRPKRNRITANLVHDNGAEAIRLAESDDNTFATNTFVNNGPKLRFQSGLRNTLDGNAIPNAVAARTEAEPGASASTYVRNQPYLKIELGTNSTMIFQDAQGRIYQPDEAVIMTAVAPSGSTLTLTAAGVGSASTVVARNFWVGATPGDAFVNGVVWAPSTRTEWWVTAAAVGQALQFTVGDLTPNTTYQVRKAAVAFTNLNTDATGKLRLTDTATTTSPVSYSVEIPNTNITSVRYSASLNRIYVENGVSASLTAIKSALPTAPLELVNASGKVWLLRADLLVQDGSTLRLHGSGAGGDVDELRLLSLNTGQTGTVVSLTADWGNLDIDSTKITSWDSAVNGPDSNSVAFGRAFLRARSSLSTNGTTALESRMDIRRSEICYLGSDVSEGYGLVWKVSGTDPNPNTSIYDRVNVYGNVTQCRLHDNYIGAYTLGSAAMLWSTNEIYQNVEHGLDMHSESDGLVLHGNSFHHNGSHGLVVGAQCHELDAQGNRCWSNARNGILLDKDSSDSALRANQCFDNGESGIALVASLRQALSENLLLRNGGSGLRVSLGSADNTFQGNTCVSNDLYGIYCDMGGGTPPAGNNGRPKRNVFTANLALANGADPLRVADSDENTFTANVFTNSTGKVRFQRGLRNWFDSNVLPPTLPARTEGEVNVTASTYVRNQAYMRIELGTNGSTIFQDAGGRIYQPDEADIPTAITTDGTTLTLTTEGIGSSSTVVARNLRASTLSGTALLHHLIWTNGTTGQWSAEAGFVGQSLTFSIDSLLANQDYVIRKMGAPFITLHSSALGQLQISDIASMTGPVVYSLQIRPTNNTPPVLPFLTTRTIAESTLLRVVNTATDEEAPASQLDYTLLAAPEGASISGTGIITWTPTEAQGPTTATFITVVSDNGTPPLRATNLFDVIVTESNSAPTLTSQSAVTLGPGANLRVTNTASDPDLPANRLTYRLVVAPPNADIAANGVITWTPTSGRSTNTFTTVVTDDGVPALSATNSFLVMADGQSGSGVTLRIRSGQTGSVVLSWPASATGWVLQQTDLLAENWETVNTEEVPVVDTEFQLVLPNLASSAFYRLVQTQP